MVGIRLKGVKRLKKAFYEVRTFSAPLLFSIFRVKSASPAKVDCLTTKPRLVFVPLLCQLLQNVPGSLTDGPFFYLQLLLKGFPGRAGKQMSDFLSYGLLSLTNVPSRATQVLSPLHIQFSVCTQLALNIEACYHKL